MPMRLPLIVLLLVNLRVKKNWGIQTLYLRAGLKTDRSLGLKNDCILKTDCDEFLSQSTREKPGLDHLIVL